MPTPTFKIVNPGGNTPTTLQPMAMRSSGLFPGDMPNAVYTQAQQNLTDAIAAATTPKAKPILDSTTHWAMPDVSKLLPQATPPAIIPHDWLGGLTTWLYHLLPSLSLSSLPIMLSTWLGGLAPLLLGFLGVTALHKLMGGFAPHTRAAGEYANYGAIGDDAVQRAQAHGATGIYTDEQGNVFIPRYHLGAARRSGLKGH